MNSAERLIKVLDKMTAYPGEHRMLQMWTSVFDIESNGEHVEEDVTVCLLALKREIELTRTLLVTKGVPAENAAATLDRLRDTTSPSRLSRPWQDQLGNLATPENRLALQWCAWALADQAEGDLASDARAELRADLLSLQESLHGVEMAPVLRRFVQQQIDAIQKALRLYELQGAQPFKQAVKAAATEKLFQAKELQAAYDAAPADGKTTVDKTMSILLMTAEVADGLSKATKSGEETSLSQSAKPLLGLFALEATSRAAPTAP